MCKLYKLVAKWFTKRWLGKCPRPNAAELTQGVFGVSFKTDPDGRIKAIKSRTLTEDETRQHYQRRKGD